MNNSLRLFLELLVLSIMYWVIIFSLYAVIRYNGLEEELSFYTDDELFLPINLWHKITLIMGLIVGFFYAIIEWFFDRFLTQKLVLGAIIIIKIMLYISIITSLLVITVSLLEEHGDIDLPNDLDSWHTNSLFLNFGAYFILMSIVFLFIRITNEKFGRGVLLNMLIGKYKQPKEEERILMFLDLKDSTTIAEKLGHKLYSKFIQNCFSDLDRILYNYQAEIYQYVGDEAVISWSPKKGFNNNNCINLFFAFQTVLKSKTKYYTKKYNYVPEFKAGIHFGKLIIAEVGTIKKEIAYHGDVINTTARIQGLCNRYNSVLLISEFLLQRSTIKLNYTANFIGNLSLKGKEEKLKIYSIESKKSDS